MPFSIHLFRRVLQGPGSAPARERTSQAFVSVMNRLRGLPFLPDFESQRWYIVI